MAALADAPSTRPWWRPPQARFLAWHPEWWVYALSGLAAAWLALPTFADAVSGAAGHSHDQHTHEDAVAAGSVATGSDWSASSPWAALSAWAEAWQHWMLMVAAMMLPVVAAQVRGVALRSLWSRRHRAAVAFVVGFLSAWFTFGGVLVAMLVAAGSPELSSAWLAGILLVAAAWQVSRPRRRVLRRCGSVRLGRPSGGAADLDCAHAGLRSGLRCVVTCGPIMLAMVVSHSLLLMVALLVVMLSERARGPDPVRRAGRPLEAWALLAFAVLAAAWAAVQ